VSGVIIVSAGASQALVTKIGVRTVLATGMGLTAVGLVYFSQVSVGGSYLADLAPGFILTGVGLGFSFVPVTIAALVGVDSAEAESPRASSTRRSRSAARWGRRSSRPSPSRGRPTTPPATTRRRSCRCSRRSTATRRRSWSGRSSPRSAWLRR
jgi:hypothetical protein